MTTETLIQEKTNNVKEVVQIALSTEIKTLEQRLEALDQVKIVKLRIKELNDLRLSMTKPIDESKKRIMEMFRPSIESLEKSESHLKRILIAFDSEQERLRQNEERKLQEAARAEEERKRAQLERQAIKAEERGDIEKADTLRDAAMTVSVVAPIIESSTPKKDGLSIRKIWKWRVTNENIVPRNFFIINEAELSKIARSGLTSVMNIPGIEFYPEESAAVRV